MADILGLGLSHFGGFMFPEEDMASRVKARLADGSLPESLDDPSKWPEPMRAEWGNDDGTSFARRHKQAYFDGLDRIHSLRGMNFCVDLSATLKTGAASPRETLFYYREGKIFAVRHGRYKAHLITETANVPDTGRTLHERPLLYDLDLDPGERFDVADRHPEVVARIPDVMAAHQATVKPVANQLILHAEEEH